MVTLSPRSTASSRSEKCRDASVAVMLFMKTGYLIIRFSSIGLVARLAGIAGPGKDDESVLQAPDSSRLRRVSADAGMPCCWTTPRRSRVSALIGLSADDEIQTGENGDGRGS